MSKIRQDLPPPGGYKPIPYLRVPAKTYFKGTTMFLGHLAIQMGAIYIYSFNHEKVKVLEIEDRSSRMAMLPMLIAEKDRAYLMNIRKMRDDEERLMKDVPGWEVGTYWGEPVYHTRPKDEWHDAIINEFYAQASNSAQRYAGNFHKWL